MGYLTFFGNLFIAFGPAAALFYWVISRSSRLIILTIGSSFFWLLSVLLDSIWWFVIPPLREKFWWSIPWSVAFQELFRFIFFKLYIKAEKGFSDSQSTAHLTTHPDNFKAALAFGWGIGVTHGAVYFATLLWQSVGPGNYFSDACPSVNIFLILALQEFCFILYHILWSVVAFDGFREKNKKKISSVIICHLLAAFLTMLNLVNCAVGVVLQFGLLAAFGALTWFILMKTTSLNTTRSPVQVLH